MARVRGRSMEPTLHDGDRVLLNYSGQPRLGTMHVVRLPDGTEGPRPLAIKRVIKLDASGWFVESDNLGVGVDSWTVGSIPDPDMVARVIAVMPSIRRVRATWSQQARS